MTTKQIKNTDIKALRRLSYQKQNATTTKSTCSNNIILKYNQKKRNNNEKKMKKYGYKLNQVNRENLSCIKEFKKTL